MFNQSNYRKRTKKITKQRLNWYQLRKELHEIKKINQHQITLNNKQIWLNEGFDARLRALEQAQRQTRQGLYQRLRAWLLG